MDRRDQNAGIAGQLLVTLHRGGAAPMHRQLEFQLRQQIRRGLLRPNLVLPPSRALASDLGLSRGVVVEAYRQLVAEGYLVSRPGGYTRVSPRIGAFGSATSAARQSSAGRHGLPKPPLVDFRLNQPDVSQFPRTRWLRSTRKVLTEMPHARLGELEAYGAVELRDVMADYLNRVRGTSAQSGTVLITRGFLQALRLLLKVLASNGFRVLAVEDPCEGELWEVGTSAGLGVVGVPVREGGLDVEELDRTNADVVLVTAAHQFPTGIAMSGEVRTALLAWARRRGALVIEDDYDAEYRYDREPVGALQGLAPERVAYIGSASKTLAPGLRLGWLILPDHLVHQMAAARQADDRGSPVIDQLVFADFVAAGHFDRHLRRMRPRYRKLRDTLVDSLAHRLPDLRPVGAPAGLQVLMCLPAELSEPTALKVARSNDVEVYGLRPYWFGEPGFQGLIFGYGGLSEAEIVRGVELLGDAVDALY